VDVLVTGGSQATKAAKEATASIPIVFVAVSDPVGAGFATSLARPGGNVTGVTNQLCDLTGKWLQLAREVVPRLRHLGIMWNPADDGSALSFKDAQARYPAFGVKMTSLAVRSPEDFDGAFEILSRERPDLLIVHPSPVIFRHRHRVAEFRSATSAPDHHR
jgi:putative tryptophan/tyrosine transport system substrate-binding protein